MVHLNISLRPCVHCGKDYPDWAMSSRCNCPDCLRARFKTLNASRNEILELAADKVRSDCPMCDEGNVPDADRVVVECEYCGRPIRSIRALKEKK